MIPPLDRSDLVAGALALDFANTLAGDRDGTTSERLTSCRVLIAWARLAGVVDAGAERRLLAAARGDTRAAADTLRLAITLREAIYTAFNAIATGNVPPAEAVRTIAEVLAMRLPSIALASTNGRYEWAFPQGEELNAILGPIAANAFELLGTKTPERIGRCDGDNCGWLFYDTSKAGRRRWCSMQSACGNRAKARRYREHRRTERSSDT